MGWRSQGDARREPASRTVQASRKELQAIKAKQQRPAAGPDAAVRVAQSKAVVNLDLGAPASCEEVEHLEFTGALDPGLIGGRAKQGPRIGRVDFHVGRERVGSQHHFRGQGRPAKSVGAGI